MIGPALVVALGLGLAAPPLRPPSSPQDPRAIEAHRACLVGHHQQGIELLTELYLETRDPIYVYNQGRCYQQNGLGDSAAARFREYLRLAKNLTPGEEAEVHRQIRDSERGQQPVVPATVVPPSPSEIITQTSGKNPRAPAPPSAPHRTAGIVLASIGAAALVAGALAGWKVHSLESDIKRRYDPDKDRSAPRYEWLQWSAYLAGAMGVGTGVWLMLPVHESEAVAVGFGTRF